MHKYSGAHVNGSVPWALHYLTLTPSHLVVVGSTLLRHTLLSQGHVFSKAPSLAYLHHLCV